MSWKQKQKCVPPRSLVEGFFLFCVQAAFTFRITHGQVRMIKIIEKKKLNVHNHAILDGNYLKFILFSTVVLAFYTNMMYVVVVVVWHTPWR